MYGSSRAATGIAEPVQESPLMTSLGGIGHEVASPYLELGREAWAALAAQTTNPLTPDEIRQVRGLGDTLDMTEVTDVYLPLSQLLSLYVESKTKLHHNQEAFLHSRTPPRTPFVIGVAGSVAVGKSTAARLLQQMLAHWPATA